MPPRPAADAARVPACAAVQAASDLQSSESLGPVDGEAAPERRPPGPAGDHPYAPPGGFGPGPDGPRPPLPPRLLLHHLPLLRRHAADGGPYDRLPLDPFDRRPMPQRYGTSPDDPEMQKLNNEEAHLEARRGISRRITARQPSRPSAMSFAASWKTSSCNNSKSAQSGGNWNSSGSNSSSSDCARRSTNGPARATN